MKPSCNALDNHSWQALVAVTRGAVREAARLQAGKVLLLGSAADCDVKLADTSLPPVHSYLIARPEGVIVGWLGYEPVPTIDGEPFLRQSLKGVHRLRVGVSELRLEVNRATQAVPATKPIPLSSPVAEQRARELLADIRASMEKSSEAITSSPPLRIIGRDGVATKPRRLQFAGNYGPTKSKYRRA